MVDEAISGGYRIVTISENLFGNIIRDLETFYSEYQKSFEFKFVEPYQLTRNEKIVFDLTDKIFSLIWGNLK